MEQIESLQRLAEQFGRLEGIGRKTALRLAFSVLEMSGEEAADFAAKHAGALRASAKISYIVRMATLVGTLVLALLIKNVFSLIPTLVPLLMLRPLLTAAQLIKAKRGK